MLETPKALDTDNVTIREIGTSNFRMDNQQEIDLAYLAGLYDGEGCFTLGLCHKKNTRLQINPTIQVTNTNTIILDFVIEMLSKYDIPHHVNWRMPTKRCRPYASINVHRREAMEKILQLLIPYLKGKRRQAELMLEFIQRRLAAFRSAQRNTGSWRYEERDWEIARQIQALNQKGRPENLNDYTSDAQPREDIVSPAVESCSVN